MIIQAIAHNHVLEQLGQGGTGSMFEDPAMREQFLRTPGALEILNA